MKKNLIFLLTVLLTLVSVTSLFAQNSFSVKYIAQSGFGAPPPELIRVEADYDRHNHIISPPNSSTQTTPILESKHIVNGTTVTYLTAPTPSPNKAQTFELFHLKVIWTAYDNGVPFSRVYTFNGGQIIAANGGTEINELIPQARIRLKAIHSGTHVLYQITLQTF
ncbi:hypothetical protein ACM46_00820 [Chryseobacterium angstadtii]|uniref:Uncharacterized protein n=1 Tax=Chryseobacterium angstadtii TaxID=558151 RepID=A0A0J7LB08_9FLAO|nr:hypothetical protein [Chryseobacterium angstadtii]KMQ66140.1 hypothetical protein ACM46_00820 [Chryseobacterium angstadtii]